jgi:hypothetical protein
MGVIAPIGAAPKAATSAERAVSRWAAGNPSKQSVLMTVPYYTRRVIAYEQ